MPIIVSKTAYRAVLRYSHQLQRHTHLPKRCNGTKSNINPTPAPPKNSAIENGTSIPVPNTIATLPLWQRLGPLSRGFEAYGRSQRDRPYLTQFISSIIIYFCGDQIAQSINDEPYDPKRTLRALAIGAGSSIPSYKWFMFLGTHFNYSSHLLSLSVKVVVNQLCFTPVFNTYFFGMQALLSGFSIPETLTHLKNTVPISAINSCKLWPAVTAFNFTFISPQYRSIFAGFIAIGWQTYLSYLNRKAEEEEAVKRKSEAGLEGKDSESKKSVQEDEEKLNA